MLSYRHSFHAGNFADVLKHIVQIEILEHLTKKEKPFDYIDTHSGAGLFNLQSGDAQKLQEYKNGIAKLSSGDFPEAAAYFETIASFNRADKFEFYPGSPSIARSFLRPRDKAWLFELHPQDFERLSNNMGRGRKIKIIKSDGLKGMLRLVPTASRRALILIDPSYEIKTEYERVVDTVIKAHKKFSTATYAIWYPVVERRNIDSMERKLIASGIKDIHRFELALAADSSGHGMTSSGMFVINPPWTLHDKMRSLLPKLSKALTGQEHFYKCDILVRE